MILRAAPQPQRVIERIDDDHANAPRLWRELGAPKYLDHAQVARLEAASRLTPEPHSCAYEDGAIHLDVAVPPHGVAAITLQWRPDDDAAEGAPA